MADIYGHEIGELPEGFYATGVVVLVRGASTADMTPALVMRRSENVPAWEIVGMSIALYDEARAATAALGGDDDDSDDGEPVPA